MNGPCILPQAQHNNDEECSEPSFLDSIFWMAAPKKRRTIEVNRCRRRNPNKMIEVKVRTLWFLYLKINKPRTIILILCFVVLHVNVCIWVTVFAYWVPWQQQVSFLLFCLPPSEQYWAVSRVWQLETKAYSVWILLWKGQEGDSNDTKADLHHGRGTSQYSSCGVCCFVWKWNAFWWRQEKNRTQQETSILV